MNCAAHNISGFFSLPSTLAQSKESGGGMEVRRGHGDIQADLGAIPCHKMSGSAITAQREEEEDGMLLIMAFVFASGH